MAVRTQNPIFLEDWLQSKPSPSPPPASAKSILQAWSDLRDMLQNRTLTPLHVSSIITLRNSQNSLHVADPHAKLLLSLLSDSNISIPTSSLCHLLRLTYIWVRKSSRPSPSLLDSSIGVISGIFPTDPKFLDRVLVSEAVLLLGALSMVSILTESSRKVCLDLLCRLLDDESLQAIRFDGEVVPEVLAGIGYALIRCESSYYGRFIRILMVLWRYGPPASLLHGLMILKLVEWLVLVYFNLQFSDRIEFICREISMFRDRDFVKFAVVMAAAGVLRGGSKTSSQTRMLVEECIDVIAGELVTNLGNLSGFTCDSECRLLLQCISLGLARSRLVFFSASVLICLTFALLIEIFPLQSYYGRIIENANMNSAVIEVGEVKEHVDSVLFKEVGAVTSAFCKQYDLADEKKQLLVETYVWQYCSLIYSNHRLVALILQGNGKELLLELEKIAEAAFLMVAFFASSVAKHRVSAKFLREVQWDVSVNILVAFSCVEHFRRGRLPEYSDTIRCVVLNVQESDLACTSFVESMPPYLDVTNLQGSNEIPYAWHEDEILTARILFYLRVIPTCIERIPHDLFAKKVAPIMFLYIRHPTVKLARASHSVFVAFVSSKKDEQEDRVLLKEQLVFYYMQRALEAYPGSTPFEGIASGVAAIIRHLPAGSPAIFYCIHALVEKVTLLCNEAVTQTPNVFNKWEEKSEPSLKILDYLLHLVALVDIQVLPLLLQMLSQLIALLPKDGQIVVLDEAYSLIADSDDVTRKPTLVSWIQSLSFLCSQKSHAIEKHEAGTTSAIGGSNATGDSCGTFRLNSIFSRL